MWEMQSFSSALKSIYSLYISLEEMESLSDQVNEINDRESY